MQIISFLLIGAAVYFFIVLPVTNFLHGTPRQTQPDPTTKKCPKCSMTYRLLPAGVRSAHPNFRKLTVDYRTLDSQQIGLNWEFRLLTADARGVGRTKTYQPTAADSRKLLQS